MNTSKDSIRNFEKAYLQLRQKESRLLEDAIVKKLPFLTHGPHKNEWKLRTKSAKRFIQYLQSHPNIPTILEIGCGNGWFTKMISQHTSAHVYGTDINLKELEQAKKIFHNDQISFIEFDLFNSHWNHPLPDLIVFNASIQYFPHLSDVINKAQQLLNKGGQIHIIDSPFYRSSEIENAKRRSTEYFKKMNTPEMDQFYFHHSLNELHKYHPTFLYKPFKFPFDKFIQDSPFLWISISKHYG